ncbi:MAG: glycosyltransferase family 2 protein [Planctomycetaceae bacterium]
MLVIVLATYNGEKYLHEQIDSICAQTVAEWTLLVSDDNSSDATLELLRRLAREDRRIRLMPQASRRLGPTMNFARLLSHAYEVGAQYVALADQDDVWFPTKLKSQLERIHAIEAAAGREQPALVHTDAEVVDTMLNPIAGSRHHFSGSSNQAHFHSNALGRLLLHAYVQGCTIMVNRPLLDFIVPVPPAAVSHDWWCSLCAAASGTIDSFPSRRSNTGSMVTIASARGMAGHSRSQNALSATGIIGDTG